MSGTKISTFPIHLGLGATAEVEPEFTGEMAWYAGYTERHGDDGAEGRLAGRLLAGGLAARHALPLGRAAKLVKALEERWGVSAAAPAAVAMAAPAGDGGGPGHGNLLTQDGAHRHLEGIPGGGQPQAGATRDQRFQQGVAGQVFADDRGIGPAVEHPPGAVDQVDGAGPLQIQMDLAGNTRRPRPYGRAFHDGRPGTIGHLPAQ